MDFSARYDRQSALAFLRGFLPDDYQEDIEENILPGFSPRLIQTVSKLGTVPSLNRLQIFEVRHQSENDPRISLSREAFRLLAAHNIRNALIFFVTDASPNYRLSLVTVEFNWNKEDAVKREYSNPRRYSYFLGPDAKIKTPTQYLVQKDKIKNFEELQSRFSVEVVTEDFYEQFREYFDQLKILFIKNNIAIVNVLKDRGEEQEMINKYCFTLLGRIFFIYFLQRKGWLNGNISFIKEAITDKKSTPLISNFFETLFFEVFAKPKDQRSGLRDVFQAIPYLNGGLFERHELEREFPIIHIPDEYFQSLINDFLEIYNFTIEEDTPLDKEVSIDPEMLGKVFENLLQEEERNAKGTFYTPRDVVHFMVCSSLLQFLVNETDIQRKHLESVIYDDSAEELTLPEKRLIDGKLRSVKILDPSVGSGAFPVGALHEIAKIRRLLGVSVGPSRNDAELKKEIIKHNLYGVDIDPGAVEMAKLRLWLSLVVDYEIEDVEPLPNLDFQFRLGNSLEERVAGFPIITDEYLTAKISAQSASQLSMLNDQPSEQMSFELGQSQASSIMIQMREIVDEYFEEQSESRRTELREGFDRLEREIFEARISDLRNQAEEQLKNITGNPKKMKDLQKTFQELEDLEGKVKHGMHKLFIPKLHFAEVFREKGGFDIAIANPPYGVKVEKEIVEQHGLESRDSYGVFMSTTLKRFLKPGGVMCFVVSDTFMTIKSHRPLRSQLVATSLHHFIRLHADTFNVMVNACVFLLTNAKAESGHQLIAADLTNISTRRESDELKEKLYTLSSFVGEATPKHAVYCYPQSLITSYSNAPIFVASPKLFLLMNDVTCQKQLERIGEIREEKEVEIRNIEMNGKVVKLARFGGFADVKQGLATGDNMHYLFQEPHVRGSYRSIEDMRDFVLTPRDLDNISGNVEKRNKIVERGIHKSKVETDFDADLWFEGRYIIPYDKGGESDTDSGWMPNYYVPTEYYIDWSMESVHRLKNLTTKQRNQADGIDGGDDRPCSRFQNTSYYFRRGITFSPTGIYAPTFRLLSIGPFDKEGSGIFCDNLSLHWLLAVLSSRLLRYIMKEFINHTVHAMPGDIAEFPILSEEKNGDLAKLVKKVIEKQQSDRRYDYMSNEQKAIDAEIYKMYGLSREDVCEIETWFARRYPKLAKYADL